MKQSNTQRTIAAPAGCDLSQFWNSVMSQYNPSEFLSISATVSVPKTKEIPVPQIGKKNRKLGTFGDLKKFLFSSTETDAVEVPVNENCKITFAELDPASIIWTQEKITFSTSTKEYDMLKLLYGGGQTVLEFADMGPMVTVPFENVSGIAIPQEEKVS